MTIEIVTRREPFVDTYLVEQTGGTRLQLPRPVSGGIVLGSDEPWARPGAGYGTVIADSDTCRSHYREVFGETVSDDGRNRVTCYAEGEDGIAWPRPDLGSYEIAGC
jgi:hypothetical protein